MPFKVYPLLSIIIFSGECMKPDSIDRCPMPIKHISLYSIGMTAQRIFLANFDFWSSTLSIMVNEHAIFATLRIISDQYLDSDRYSSLLISIGN